MLSKKASTKTSKEAPSEENSSPFIKILSIMLTVVILILAGITYWSFSNLIIKSENEQLASLSKDFAQLQAGAIQQYVRRLKSSMQNFTQLDDLVSAIENNDEASLTRTQSSIRQQLNAARGVRIDKRNTVEVDPDAEVPVSFAEVDLINRTARRESTSGETIRRNDEWRLNLAEPIPFSATDAEVKPEVLATLFVSFAVNEIQTLLSRSDLSKGKTEWLQQFGEARPQTILSIGQGEAGDSQEYRIPQTNWIVRFTPSPFFAEQANVSAVLLIAILFLVAVITISGTVYTAARTSKAIVARRERIAMAEKTAVNVRTTDPFDATSKKKLLDMEVQKEDENILNLKERDEVDPLDIADTPKSESAEQGVPSSIFRSYDIRGIVPNQLSPTNVVLIGKAIGSQALDAGEKAIIVGRDGRTHSNDVSEQLIEGILSTGCHVINIGTVPTPLVYFAIAELETSNSGVSVTASHNPAEYNGFKIVINGKPLVDDEIRQLHSRTVSQQFASGSGKEDFTDLSFQYIDKIASDVALPTDLKVVVDAGNGIAGDLGPKVLTEIGCEVIPLYCQVDGNFPNHQPDPSVDENLQDLINKVKEEGADLGIALDGDGDRVGIVTASGKIIRPDRLLMLLAKDILSRNPGTDVIFDVKSSRELNDVISTYGGRPIMWKSGHSHMKSKMIETKASLGGELSGHLFIAERWYGFDDGIYAAARILEIMSLREQDLDSIFESFPAPLSTPELKIPVAEEAKFGFMKRLVMECNFDDGRLTTLDGLRVDFENGWGLVRASNTSPALTLRFEANDEATLEEIKSRFKQEIQKIDSSLALDF